MGQRQRDRRQREHPSTTPPAGPATPPDPADAARLLREAFDTAVGGLLPGEAEHGEQMAEALLDLAAEAPRGAVHLEVAARTRLLADVERAWERGWQPADLARHARRALSSHQVKLLAAAVAADLAGHPADTVDPRWAEQLTETGARVTWTSDQTFLTARAEAGPLGWLGAVADALAVAVLLSRLTPLEILGPIPGRARLSAAGGASARADVDERLLARVRALLAKAESTTFPAEAETFTAGAQSLMARHSIDAALLAASGEGGGDRRPGVASIRLGIDEPYEHPKAVLLTSVASANHCRSVWSQQYGYASVIGFPSDLAAVQVLFTSLLVQATSGLTGPAARGQQSRSRAFRRSFLLSFAARIHERLTEAVAAETAAAAARQPGASLVPVMRAREEEVEAAVAERHPSLVKRRTSPASDAAGWWAGRSAADRASLAAHAPLPTPSP